MIGMVLSFNQLRTEWITAGGSPREADVAAAVAKAESGGDNSQHNASDPFGGSWCSWQINGAHSGVFNMQGLTHDPYACAIAAVYVRHKQGWNAWSTHYYGKYLAFMPHHHVRAMKAHYHHSSPRHFRHHATRAHVVHHARAVEPSLSMQFGNAGWSLLGGASLAFAFHCLRKLKRLFAKAVREEAAIIRRAARQREYRAEQALRKRTMPRTARRLALNTQN